MSLHPEVFINVGIFSMFFAMLSMELMAASAILFRYKESEKKVIPFIIPIWEITGTFFVFYVVNLEALVPSILPLIAYTFISYILFFLIIFVLRNAAIISAEYVWKNRFANRKSLYKIYAVVTFVLGAVVLMIYASMISGAGINYSLQSFNASKFVSFLPNDGFVIGSAIILFGIASVFYNLFVDPIMTFVTVIVGMVIAGASFYEMGDLTTLSFVAIPIIITLAIPVLNFMKGARKYLHNKILFQGLLAVAVFFLAMTDYPYLLGKTLNVNDILNNSAMQIQIFYSTIVGGVILLLMTILFFRIYSKQNGKLAESV